MVGGFGDVVLHCSLCGAHLLIHTPGATRLLACFCREAAAKASGLPPLALDGAAGADFQQQHGQQQAGPSGQQPSAAVVAGRMPPARLASLQIAPSPTAEFKVRGGR